LYLAGEATGTIIFFIYLVFCTVSWILFEKGKPMKSKNFGRPDKMLLKGIRSLGTLKQTLYTDKKVEAKAKAELTFIGKKRMDKVQSQLYAYNADSIDVKKRLKSFEFLKEVRDGRMYWLNFHGIHDVKIIQNVGNLAGLDRLTLRQILDTTLRPKVEHHDHYSFISVKSILKVERGDLNIEQISFLLGDGFLVSFQEQIGDHFEDIRNKMDEGLGFIRTRKCDYLLSQLLDAILDNYFESIEKINKDLLQIEDRLLRNPDNDLLLLIENLTKSSQIIKKALGPFKEAIQNVINSDKKLIKKDTIKYYRDLANSSQAAIEEMDHTISTLDSLKNIYFAQLSQKMNETMKVLTLVATIFIPLTFIAGIYGMNFDVMPELRHPNGYFITLGVMGGITLGMLTFFKVKKWL
jgi:magnesium transporter